MKTRILLSILVLAFVATGFKCGGSEEDGIFKGKLYNNKQFRTTAGATIASKTEINPAFGPLVDGGFVDVNRIASGPPNNYNVSDMPPSFYRVWLFPRSPRCENPAFLVDATGSPYEGSEWDKDPSPNRCLVCAAGLTMMQGLPITGAGMVITDDMGVMRTIVRYEAEHSILWFKDPERYAATQYHTQGQGHPILGEGLPTDRLFESFVYKAVTIKLPVDVKSGDSIIASEGQTACVLLTK